MYCTRRWTDNPKDFMCVVDLIKFLFTCSWYCYSVVLLVFLVSCEGSYYLERVPEGAEPVYDVLNVSVVCPVQ